MPAEFGVKKNLFLYEKLNILKFHIEIVLLMSNNAQVKTLKGVNVMYIQDNISFDGENSKFIGRLIKSQLNEELDSLNIICKVFPYNDVKTISNDEANECIISSTVGDYSITIIVPLEYDDGDNEIQRFIIIRDNKDTSNHEYWL